MNTNQKRDFLKSLLRGEGLSELNEMIPLFPEGEVQTFNEVRPGVFLDSVTGQRLNEETQRYYQRIQNYTDDGETLPMPLSVYVYPGRPQ